MAPTGSVKTCDECERLSAIYRERASEHVLLSNRLKDPSTPRHPEELERLLSEIEAAKVARASARAALRDHQKKMGHRILRRGLPNPGPENH